MSNLQDKYKPEYIQSVDEYLALCVDEELEYHKTRGEKSDSFERRIKVKLPTKEGFAAFIGRTSHTVDAWEDKYPDFGKAVAKIKTTQREKLLENGLSGEYNPLITKLLLSAVHGLSEKTEVAATITDTSLTPEQKAKLDKLLL